LTQADIETVQEFARAVEREVSDYHAAVYLQAKEILRADPDNPYAKEVVTNFNHFLKTGEERTSFAQFFLPCPETDEEKAESERLRRAYVSTLTQSQLDALQAASR